MKHLLFATLTGLLLFQPASAGVDGLGRLFAPGRAVLDLDGDGFPEKPAITVIIPDKPTARELALAADIAARANFESLAIDFGIVRRESEVGGPGAPPFPVLVGSRLVWAREAFKDMKAGPEALAPNQGLVFLFTRKDKEGIACIAGSEEALLKTGRAFFLRWPYFWEVWGRETGATYMSLEKDLAAFLAESEVPFERAVVTKALYEFPVAAPASDGLRALSFDQGQIRNLTIELYFAAPADRDRAADALRRLQAQQRRGLRTAVLSYPACAALTFELRHAQTIAEVVLARTGATKRLLTPGFKERPGAGQSAKEFDLTSLFSTKGLYADQDRDGIPDALDARLVVPDNSVCPGIDELTSRMVMATAGASFPIVQLDDEVESRKALAAPVLVGENSLTADLVRTGKLKLPALEAGSGVIKVVPKAFGKSSALVVQAADGPGLGLTVSYLSRTFPFFASYGEGNPQLLDLASALDKLLSGEKGGAEAFLMNAVEKASAELRGRDIVGVEAELLLPGPNPSFERAVKDVLGGAAGAAAVKVTSSTMRSGRTVFDKAQAFTWEVDDVLALLKERLRAIVEAAGKGGGVDVAIGVSESPSVREKVRRDVAAVLREAGFPEARVEVLCAYKPGYFWLTEKVLPALKARSVHHLTVRFSEERADLTQPRRTHAEPGRWLQELYPVDEVLSRELGVPLDRIDFEVKEPEGPVYEVRAYDANDAVAFEADFSPRTREIALSAVLPEWGTAKVTTGWLRVRAGGREICDLPVQTDLERFWGFYQEDVLRAVVAHIRKKTGDEPTFSKQPYFKRLWVDLKASEPDYRIGLDEEIVSSLEAVHDELYFDTLDLLRGITRFDPEDRDAAADASRSSAPGNVFPSLHPSLEGGRPEARVVLEDWAGPSPQVVVRWTEKGRDEVSRKTVFPALKPKDTQVTELVFDGRSGRVGNVVLETEWERESDYLAVIDLLGAWRRLSEAGALADRPGFAGLDGFTVRLRFQTQTKDERLTGGPALPLAKVATPPAPRVGEAIVTTREIISPAMAGEIARRLAALPGVRSYSGGISYEGRDVPVLELYRPFVTYVSLPRLVTFKPTLQAVGRQHANEVSSTNYLLRFAELLARDPTAAAALDKVNFVFEPMENPDGAELAYEMQKNEPFHSLHAGRYGALGVDMGYQTGTKPLLPEAAVRTRLYERWLPDVFLNLHGYPSHEWVQPFSNYTPYLFRDYWIPKGWFTYFRYLSLPIYGEPKAAGQALMKLVAEELNAAPGVAASNRRFYDRYERWSARWAPHMNALEIADGVNIYAKRRGPTENRLTARAQTTFAEETPEVMDETATGDWLEFLCEQGLAYLRAHVKYLAGASYDVVRIEEEVRDRVRLTFVRGRPGKPAGAPAGR